MVGKLSIVRKDNTVEKNSELSKGSMLGKHRHK